MNYVQEKGDGDGDGDVRFTDIQIADCGNTVPADSAYAKDSDVIGAPIWRSPEAQLRIGWGTPTDIWSFGAIVCISTHNIYSLSNMTDSVLAHNINIRRQLLHLQTKRSCRP